RYNQLERYLDIFKGRIPKGFIPIGDDPGGNMICLGMDGKYRERIYFWDHEEECEDMSNMYFLADDIYEFLNRLYDDEE
ncbi:SMI1/KNR4 family protein, partial [Paenibacillus plantiphilus]|uniref:SMI1/KNR4 family protein n=1 Tax=Paenibacillus plantiphilus TaxID=2905650 RepID=UPI001F422E92